MKFAVYDAQEHGVVKYSDYGNYNYYIVAEMSQFRDVIHKSFMSAVESEVAD